MKWAETHMVGFRSDGDFVSSCYISLTSCSSGTCEPGGSHAGAVEYSLTAEFSEGDPAYDWILAFLVNSSHLFQNLV